MAKIAKEDYEKEVTEEKSRAVYKKEFSGARSTRKSEIKSIKETQLEEGAIAKVNYKTGMQGFPVNVEAFERYVEQQNPSVRGVTTKTEQKLLKGGLNAGEQRRLINQLKKDKIFFNWSEVVYKSKIARIKSGKAQEVFKVRKRKGLKETRGRKKGTTFDARVKRYVTAKEKKELDKQ